VVDATTPVSKQLGAPAQDEPSPAGQRSTVSDEQLPENQAQPRLRLVTVTDQDDVLESAIDVLSERHQLSREDARDLLGRAGKHGTRDLYQVAEDVVLIGVPTLTPRPLARAAVVGPPALAALVLDLLAECETLQDVLTGIADLAVEAIGGIDAASVTLIRDGAPATVAASQESARAIDETQYADGHGPCLHAARTATLVQVDDVDQRADFEAWRRVARERGITATASIPIPATPHIAAALNLYSHRTGGGWDQDTLDAAEALATYAGDAVTVAYRQIRAPGLR
jgi:hypothetical protein